MDGEADLFVGGIMVDVVNDLHEIEIRVEEFERASSLGHDAFRDYFDLESKLEQFFLERAQEQIADLDPMGATESYHVVVSLNRTMVERAQRELARSGPAITPEYRSDLQEWRDAAHSLALVGEGEILLAQAQHRRLAGDHHGAMAYFEQAHGQFAEVAALPGQQWLAELKAALAEAAYLFSNGLIAMGAGRHQTARENFREVRGSYETLRLQLVSMTLTGGGATSDAQSTVMAPFAQEVIRQLAYADMMFQLASFFDHTRSSHFDRAEECITDAASRYEAWMNTVISDGCPDSQRLMMEMELSNLCGWRGWARAENSRELRDWDACRDRLKDAEESWSHSADIGVRLSYAGRASLPFEMSNIEMLLETSRRRYQTERTLWRDIERLQAEHREHAKLEVHAHATGGNTHMNERSSSYNFNSSVHAGAIGNENRVEHVNQQSGGIQINDFRKLAAELSTIASTMEQAAATDTERASAQAVRDAAQAADGSDETGVRQRLQAAGRWALEIAGRIGQTTAEAVIRQAIGV